jgi:hypothetical protein
LTSHTLFAADWPDGLALDPTARATRRYEIRLRTSKGGGRLFAICAATEMEAAEYAKTLLHRHLDCDGAEIWCGMKLIRQV